MILKISFIKEDNCISAHKFVLITRSPVFCAMFTGPAKDESPEIKIEDAEKGPFTEMLRYNCSYIFEVFQNLLFRLLLVQKCGLLEWQRYILTALTLVI